MRIPRLRRTGPFALLLIAAAGLTMAGCSGSGAGPSQSFDTSRLRLTQTAATAALKGHFDDALRALPKGARFVPIGGDGVLAVPCSHDDPSVNPPVNVSNSYVIKDAGTDDSVTATLRAYWTQQKWTSDQGSDPQPIAVVSPDLYRFSLSQDPIGLTIDGLCRRARWPRRSPTSQTALSGQKALSGPTPLSGNADS